MAEIDSTFVEQTSSQSHTGDSNWTDITGAAITSGNFVTGGKYLLLFNSWLRGNNANQVFGIRSLHGSTAFTGSNYQIEPSSTSGDFKYMWFTVWTAVASEGVKLQFATLTSTSHTVFADTITLTAIRLDDDLTENVDWHFDEDTTSTGLTSSWSTSNNASITIDSGDHDTNDLHLIMGVSQITGEATTLQQESRIERTGEATENRPLVSIEGEDNSNGSMVHYMMLAHQLGAASNTFKTSSQMESGTSGTRTYSAMFALNLAKFTAQDSAYTEAEIALSTTNWATQLQTLTFDLSGEAASRNSMIIGYFIGDHGTNASTSAGKKIGSRLQVDGTDEPTGQSSDTTHNTSWDFSDEQPQAIITQENLTAASHTIDIDAHIDDSVTAAAGEDRLIVAFTLELAGAAPPATRTLFSGPIPQPII